MQSGNGVDLAAIHQLLTEVAQTVRSHSERFDRIDARLDDHERTLNELVVIVNDHTRKLDRLMDVVNEHSGKIDDLAFGLGELRSTVQQIHFGRGRSWLGHHRSGRANGPARNIRFPMILRA